MLAAASHAWFAQADLPWTFFVEDTKATLLGLSQYWDDGLALRVQQALAAFAFPAFQYPPPKPYLTPAGECRSLFMEAVRENQCKPVRYDLTHRPLLLSSSGNASHALLLLPQAAQLWARASVPNVEGCGLPAAVRARISSVEASLTMHSALAHLHMPHTLR